MVCAQGCASSTPADDGGRGAAYVAASAQQAPRVVSGEQHAAAAVQQSPSAHGTAAAAVAASAVSAAASQQQQPQQQGASAQATETTPNKPGSTQDSRTSQDAKRISFSLNSLANNTPAPVSQSSADAQGALQGVNPSLRSLSTEEAHTVQSTLLKVSTSPSSWALLPGRDAAALVGRQPLRLAAPPLEAGARLVARPCIPSRRGLCAGQHAHPEVRRGQERAHHAHPGAQAGARPHCGRRARQLRQVRTQAAALGPGARDDGPRWIPAPRSP